MTQILSEPVPRRLSVAEREALAAEIAALLPSDASVRVDQPLRLGMADEMFVINIVIAFGVSVTANLVTPAVKAGIRRLVEAVSSRPPPPPPGNPPKQEPSEPD